MRNHVISTKAVLVVIIAMVVQLLFIVALPANAQTPVSDSSFDTIATLPDGRSAVRGCSASSGTAYDSYQSDGQFNGPVTLGAGYDWVGDCNQDSIAPDGTVVFYAAVANSNNYRVLAYKDDTLLWTHDVTDLCTDQAVPARVSVSADGRVFYEVASDCTNFNGVELVTLNLATGQELSHTSLEGINGGMSHVRNFLTGYAYVTDNYSEVVYLDLDGQKDTVRSFEPTYSMPSWFRLWSIGAHGELAILSTASGGMYCSGGVALGATVVVLRDTAGVEIKRTVTDDPYNQSCRSQSINITPSGGAVLGLVDESGSSYFIGFVSKNTSIPVKVTPTLDENSSDGGVVAVDIYGNTLYAVSYDIPDAGYYEKDQVRFVLYDPDGNFLTQDDTESVRTNNDAFHLINPASAATSNGSVHAILRRNGQYEVYRFPFAKVGIDYPRGVLLGDTSTAPEPLNYVAMGDSYSSGESVKPYIGGTNEPGINTCHRSSRAYPILLQEDPSLNLRLLDDGVNRFRACSGAKIKHVVDTVNVPSLEPPQSISINSGTDVVTLSIGGNDVGFGDVLSMCVADGATEQDCLAELNSAEQKIDSSSFADDLQSVYDTITSLGGNDTQFIVVGYPPLFPSSLAGATQSCTWGAGGPGMSGRDVSATELAKFHAVTGKLNTLIRQLAVGTSSNVHFVNPAIGFAGHELCTDTAWFNDVIASPEPTEAQQSYHPNEEGQQAYERMIAIAIKEVTAEY